MLTIGESPAAKTLTFVFKFFGLWFKGNPSIIYRAYSFILIFIIMFWYVLCLDIGLFLTGSLVEATKCLNATMPITVFYLKTMNLLYNNTRIQDMMDRIRDFKLLNNEEEKIAKHQLNLFFKLTLYYGIICNTAITLVSIRVLFLAEPQLPFENGWYPLDWEHNNTHFWIVHSYQFYGMIVLVNINLTCELLPCFFLTMVGCQLDILGMRLESLKLKTPKEIKMSQTTEAIDIINHIKTHQQIMELTEDVQKSFNAPFFAEICTVGITITSIEYQLAHLFIRSKHGDHDVVEYIHYIVFMMCTVTRIFMPCFFGNLVLTASESLRFKIYSCEWLHLPLDCKKKLITLMERLKRPTVIWAWVLFPFTLEIFKSIVQFSYTMLTLLQNMN